MDRLTMRWHGKSFCNASEEECEKSHDNERPDDCCCECEHQSAVYEKLYEYEDAEEQGLLLRLPCKVGDKVYIPGHQFPSKIWGFSINGEGVFANYAEYEYSPISALGRFAIKDIGKTVFLTREEAEQALKERESE